METPVPFPNTEVKLPMLMAVVSHKTPNLQAVFHYFYKTLFTIWFMIKKISKTQANEQIHNFFCEIRHKKSEDVKKIKNLAMSHNIKLGDRRKLFCKKCLMPYVNSNINIKEGFLKIICENCNFENRWKVKETNLGIYAEGSECC